MAKKTAQRTKDPGAPNDVGHLDETITEATTTAGATLKKYRYHIAGVVVILFVVMGVSAGVSSLGESQLVAINQRLWELVQSPAAREDDHQVNLEALDDLLAQAQDSKAERLVMKSVGDYLISVADDDAKEGSAKEGSDGGVSGGLSPMAALAKAKEIATKAKEKFKTDDDMNTWADRVLNKIEAEQNTDWLPPEEPPRPDDQAQEGGQKEGE